MVAANPWFLNSFANRIASSFSTMISTLMLPRPTRPSNHDPKYKPQANPAAYASTRSGSSVMLVITKDTLTTQMICSKKTINAACFQNPFVISSKRKTPILTSNIFAEKIAMYIKMLIILFDEEFENLNGVRRCAFADVITHHKHV